ncbi:hypothetical protein [Mycolicibacter icosiumassiliensis]|uniref:hypothetical protein n=1 Tax=Mycolicibacter icosiumassiliensis TaxID=1792835 RepID=UPI00083463BF|nr:hypothetical protein [Mycolicibacter icosiumassiliensis]
MILDAAAGGPACAACNANKHNREVTSSANNRTLCTREQGWPLVWSVNDQPADDPSTHRTPPNSGASAAAERQKPGSHDNRVVRNDKETGQIRKGRSMSHERALIFFTMFMIAMVGVTAGVVTWIG